MNTIFTICSMNFFRRAIVMLDSVANTTPGINTALFIVDKVNADTLAKLKKIQKQHSVIFACDLNIKNYNEMCFKYTLVELNTAIKPNAFNYLFCNGTRKAIYLDPDILVLDNLSEVFVSLETCSALVTPHTLSDDPPGPGMQPYFDFLMGGIMNLGFIAITNDDYGKRLLAWWEGKLFDGAFVDKYLSTAYDQKWVDCFPSLFGDRIHIERNPGYNVAPWNIHERELLFIKNYFLVKYKNKNYSLFFFHFSGYKSGSKELNWRFPECKIIEASPLHSLTSKYSSLIENVPEPELDTTIYAYSLFSNNVLILPIHRRFYRQLVSKLKSDPFDASGPLYKCFATSHLIANSSYTDEIMMYTKTASKKRSECLFKLFLSLFLSIFGLKKYLILLEAFYKYSRIEHNTFLIEPLLEKNIKRRV